MPSQWSRPRIIKTVVVLLALAGLAWFTRFTLDSVSLPKVDAFLAHSNAVLLSQQLQRLADQQLQANAAPNSEQLRTWQQFDERFLEENRESALYRYEAACTARRLAIHAMMLGENEKAERNCLESDRLFRILEAENPDSLFYPLDHGSLYLSWIRLLAMQNDTSGAKLRLAQARDLVKIRPERATEYFDISLAYLLHQLALLAVELGEPQVASSIARENLLVLERLTGKLDTDPNLAQIKKYAESLLLN